MTSLIEKKGAKIREKDETAEKYVFRVLEHLLPQESRVCLKFRSPRISTEFIFDKKKILQTNWNCYKKQQQCLVKI